MTDQKEQPTGHRGHTVCLCEWYQTPREEYAQEAHRDEREKSVLHVAVDGDDAGGANERRNETEGWKVEARNKKRTTPSPPSTSSSAAERHSMFTSAWIVAGWARSRRTASQPSCCIFYL